MVGRLVRSYESTRHAIKHGDALHFITICATMRGGGCESEMGGERKRPWEQAMQMEDSLWPSFLPLPSFQPQGPVPNEAWLRQVPLWEKNFCTKICLMPWEKICAAQRRLACYVKVANWDNSAGEEAFLNAKARYWAEINGLPCHIRLPDPDAYNDVVDHDAVMDDQEDSFVSADQPVPGVDYYGNASFYSGQGAKNDGYGKKRAGGDHYNSNENWKVQCRR